MTKGAENWIDEREVAKVFERFSVLFLTGMTSHFIAAHLNPTITTITKWYNGLKMRLRQSCLLCSRRNRQDVEMGPPPTQIPALAKE